MKLWTKFLIIGEEKLVNGTSSSTFNLHIDKVEDTWAQRLPELDYAIISDGHWFFRIIYLYENNNLSGCVYCNKQNVKDYDASLAVRLTFRTMLRHINSCNNFSRLVTLVRTFAPAHFENGGWNTGGYCNRTSPYNETEVNYWDSFDWKIRNIQIAEIERARKEGNKKFGVLAISKAMLMRADGHPGTHWGNQWMKGYNDCVHWCMPGPVDYWNDFLLKVMRMEVGLGS